MEKAVDGGGVRMSVDGRGRVGGNMRWGANGELADGRQETMICIPGGCQWAGPAWEWGCTSGHAGSLGARDEETFDDMLVTQYRTAKSIPNVKPQHDTEPGSSLPHSRLALTISPPAPRWRRWRCSTWALQAPGHCKMKKWNGGVVTPGADETVTPR
ncbi:hypothetical protein BD779DRAFT_1480667 [Infundibulicybe gibba]|nr:hypothetical protein BD779DRAFT_1480667 [Infundibulicybe gibba]